MHPKNKDKQTLVITDFDADEFASLNKDGAVSVTFCATDGAGNRSYRRILVHIVDSSAKDVTAKEYTRFITRKYYEASETAGRLGRGFHLENGCYLYQHDHRCF